MGAPSFFFEEIFIDAKWWQIPQQAIKKFLRACRKYLFNFCEGIDSLVSAARQILYNKELE